MNKEPITVTGLKKIKDELEELKNKKKARDSCSYCRSKITWRSKRKC